jgi:hypothetical protein
MPREIVRALVPGPIRRAVQGRRLAGGGPVIGKPASMPGVKALVRGR